MNIEEAAVKEGYFAKQRGEVGRSLNFRRPKPLMEQPEQKDAIELLKPLVVAALPHALKTVAEVIRIVIKKALLLDEVDEHHAVKHEGGVPVPVAVGGDTVYEAGERGQLRPEALIETLGQLLHVQGRADAGRNDGNSETRFVVKLKGQALQAPDHVVSGLSRTDGILATGHGLATLAFDPLPYLHRTARVDEDDQMFEGPLRNYALYLAANGVLRETVVDDRVALVHDELRLLRDRLEGEVAPVDVNAHRLGSVVVPTETLDEEAGEIEVPQVGTKLCGVGLHQEGSSLRNKPRVQMICGSWASTSSPVRHNRSSSRSDMTISASCASSTPLRSWRFSVSTAAGRRGQR